MQYILPNADKLKDIYNKVMHAGISNAIPEFKTIKKHAEYLQTNVNNLDMNRTRNMIPLQTSIEALKISIDSKDVKDVMAVYKSSTDEDEKAKILEAVDEYCGNIKKSVNKFTDDLRNLAKDIHNEINEVKDSSIEEELPDALNVCKKVMLDLSEFIKNVIEPSMISITDQLKDIDAKLEERYGSTYFDRIKGLLPSKETLEKIDFAELAMMFMTDGASEVVKEAAKEVQNISKKEGKAPISKDSQAAIIAAVYETATNFLNELSEETKFVKRFEKRCELQDEYNRLRKEYDEKMKFYRLFEQEAEDLVSMKVISADTNEYIKEIAVLEKSLTDAVYTFENALKQSDFNSYYMSGQLELIVDEFQKYVHDMKLIWH